MNTKKEAIAFAQRFNWTAKDAERAFADVDFKNANEHTLLLALVNFAGPELLERQRLQAAQKAQVTKKAKYIKEIEVEFTTKVKEYEEVLEKERSLFVSLIAGLYKLTKPFGLQDPWIEALLTKYDEYQKSA